MGNEQRSSPNFHSVRADSVRWDVDLALGETLTAARQRLRGKPAVASFRCCRGMGE